MNQANTGQIPPQYQLNNMIVGGLILARALSTAALLKLADCLIEGPKSVAELARKTETHAPSLARLMRFLSQYGVFEAKSLDVYALTSLSQLLRSDIPNSARPIALMFGDPANWAALGNLPYSIQTGMPAFDYTHGMGIWPYHHQHPEAGTVLNQAMASFSAQVDQQLVAHYDFSGVSTIIDIGGGNGGTLTTLLSQYANLKGIIFDQAAVIEQTEFSIRSAGLQERCHVVAGDFFATLPAGGDIYFFKQILHDWDDDSCLKLLRNCRSSMLAGKKILVVEQMIQPGGPGRSALTLDMVMLALFTGHERTEEEFRRLFTSSGFELSRIVATSTPFFLLEAIAQ
jgi:O-methyltransferase